MRILLVEDSHSIAQTAKELSSVEDYELISTDRADAAIDLIAHNQFDCIVLDLSTIGDSFGIVAIRSMSRTAAVVLMGTSSARSLIAESVGSGHLEFRPTSSLISSISDLAEPALLVALAGDARLLQAIKN